LESRIFGGLTAVIGFSEMTLSSTARLRMAKRTRNSFSMVWSATRKRRLFFHVLDLFDLEQIERRQAELGDQVIVDDLLNPVGAVRVLGLVPELVLPYEVTESRSGTTVDVEESRAGAEFVFLDSEDVVEFTLWDGSDFAERGCLRLPVCGSV
jgi:hypothetical protein